MKTVAILFLGAARRNSLLERFLDAGKKLGVNVRLFSCELEGDFYPISSLATIIKAPLFKEQVFGAFLEKVIVDYSIDLIIPAVDPAVVGLSDHSVCLDLDKGPFVVVSDRVLCHVMGDKILADNFFKKQGILVPSNYDGRYPKIIKKRFGAASRGITVVRSAREESLFFEQHERDGFIVQDFIDGQETTVDIYVSKKNGLVGYVLRDRLQVAAGEVMDCITRMPSKKEREIIERIASITGWVGPITLQFITDKFGETYVVEINPRFGGGATASIEAGLDMPYYLLAEYLGVEFANPKKMKMLRMVRARRDFFCEY